MPAPQVALCAVSKLTEPKALVMQHHVAVLAIAEALISERRQNSEQIACLTKKTFSVALLALALKAAHTKAEVC